MGRYLQRISLRPFAETEIWTGWILEGVSGPVDGLIEADTMTASEIASYGVREFQSIPREYLTAIRDELAPEAPMRVIPPLRPRSSRTYT
jgi:hypothetical protein